MRFSAMEIAVKTYRDYRGCCGLESIETQENQREIGSRCESTRHWGRVCERKFKNGQFVSGVMGLMVTAWFSPRLAKGVWLSLRKTGNREPREFVGRYGDGWISSTYRDWFVVPKGSKRLELELEAPPHPHVEELEFRVTLEAIPLGTFRFEDDATLIIPISLPGNPGELFRLGIDVNRSFRPSEHDSNGDDRDLAIKLVGIRWF